MTLVSIAKVLRLITTTCFRPICKNFYNRKLTCIAKLDSIIQSLYYDIYNHSVDYNMETGQVLIISRTELTQPFLGFTRYKVGISSQADF